MAAVETWTSEYKVFIGQLYSGTEQGQVHAALAELGSPPADAGVFMVWVSTVHNSYWEGCLN